MGEGVEALSGCFGGCCGLMTAIGFWTIMSGLVFVPADKNCDGSYKTDVFDCLVLNRTNEQIYTVQILDCGIFDDCIFTFFDSGFAPITTDPRDPWSCSIKRTSWNIFTGDSGDLDYTDIELGSNKCPNSARDAAMAGAWLLTLAACFFVLLMITLCCVMGAAAMSG